MKKLQIVGKDFYKFIAEKEEKQKIKMYIDVFNGYGHREVLERNYTSISEAKKDFKHFLDYTSLEYTENLYLNSLVLVADTGKEYITYKYYSEYSNKISCYSMIAVKKITAEKVVRHCLKFELPELF